MQESQTNFSIPIEKRNPFYITNNSAYGSAWQSAGNKAFGALNSDDIP